MNLDNYIIKLSRRQRMANGQYETKTSDYLPVQGRMVWFREENKQNTKTRILDKIIDVPNQFAYFEVEVTDSNGNVEVGVGQETGTDFGDYIEKAYTKAYGRALAALGYGTQFATEFDEGDHVVDSPLMKPKEEPRHNIVAEIPKPKQTAKPRSLITQEQSKQLRDLMKEYNVPKETVAELSTSMFNKHSSIELTSQEAEILIDLIKLRYMPADTDPVTLDAEVTKLMDKVMQLGLAQDRVDAIIERINAFVLDSAE